MGRRRIFTVAIGLLSSLLTAGLLFLSCGQRVEPADLVLLNGKIVTVDQDRPQVQALAVKGDRIIAVGRDRDIKYYIEDKTKVIDLDGKLALPGFIEAHAHFMSLGKSMMRLDLTTASNWDEIVDMVREAARGAEPGEWILGRGWHQEKWNKTPMPNVDGLPHHRALSRISPNNPVLLTHASGHSCIANAVAMEMAGIRKNTADPEGGEIVKDAAGNPIGVFRETAEDSLSQAYESYQARRTEKQIEDEQRQAVDLAIKKCLAHGITSFHDAGASFKTIDLYSQLADENELDIRLWVMINEENDSLKQRLSDYRIIGYADNHLTVRAVKRVIDGALGSHGAWLLEPYADFPTSTGLNTESIEVMRETARLALENDFQLCTHAIGDRGNREILNIYEKAFAEFPEKKDLRWRVEHAQHLHPDDIPRFGDLGITAAMQGVHCTSDGPWVPKRLGNARSEEGAYVWQKLMKSGAIIANGTDAPVEDVDPLACFYASVTRKLPNGTLFYPRQCMKRGEALRSYTINGAHAAFEEEIKGSLTPGKLADIVVLSKDIMTVPAESILHTDVLYTIVGGKIMYQK